MYVHGYQNAESSASYLLRNVSLWDTKALILHNTQMSWDFLCHEMRIPLSFKNCFSIPDLCKTVVSSGVGNPLGFYE